MFRFATCRKTAATIALFALALTGSVACAQTKPKVTDAGLVQPKTIMYVGNSFFYYNNSMHNQVTRIATAADPQNRAAYRSTSIVS